MNGNIVRALFQDALAQVLDNKIFRLLVIVVFGMVLPTFLIGAREDRLVVFFGWREYEYEDILELLGAGEGLMQQGPPNELLISIIQSLFIENLAGSVGIIFCLAATAFFIPRMLEKGAADTIFSKPVSRLTLLLARYFSGLLFVSLLAVLLVGGIHVGLLITSGYSDPGFLWGAPILIYLFAPLFAVSVLAGVLTRSSTAAILVSLIFFMFGGCAHGGWVIKEYSQAAAFQERMAELADQEELQAEVPELEAVDTLKWWFFLFIDTVHYTLPKTNDADLIAQKLRKQFGDLNVAFRDDETTLLIERAPEGFVLEEGGDIAAEGLIWRSEHGTRGGDARVRLRRISRLPAEEDAGEEEPSSRRRRGRRLSLSALAREYEDEIEARPEASEVDRSYGDLTVAKMATATVTWRERIDGVPAFRETHFFTIPDWAYVIEVEGPEDWILDEQPRRPVDEFLEGLSFEDDPRQFGENPAAWYGKQVGWTAPLRYNLFFSIGSTLAFAVLVLALAWWRLKRIDF